MELIKKMLARDYQIEAVEATRLALAKHKKVLIVAPTASGKSMMIALISRFAKEKGNRVLVLCHQSEILCQNEETLNKIAPEVKTGIFCASAGRKDTQGDVIFASRDSIAGNETKLGKFKLILIDEAHLVPKKKSTRYQKIFSAIECEYYVGLSATPFRLDSGNIWGEGQFFETISYNISLDFLTDRGYLCPTSFPRLKSLVDLSTVKISRVTKDYDEKDLARVTATEDVVAKSIETWESYASNRKVSLFFTCSIAHAAMVTSQLKARGYSVGYIDGSTKEKDRSELFDDAKAGKYRALVNVGVLTTGVDIPVIDCVVMLRATKSASLFVQCVGRGLRTAPDKKDLLIIDCAGNFDRFGSLSEPVLYSPKQINNHKTKPTGSLAPNAPTKICPSCRSKQHAGKKVCGFCGHVFINHSDRAFDGQLLSEGVFAVENYSVRYSETQAGEKCVVVRWDLKGLNKVINEWVLFTRPFAREKYRQLKEKEITEVKVTKLNEAYPRVKYLKFETKKAEAVGGVTFVGW